MAATLSQIHSARHSSELRAKTESAILVASNNVRNEAPATTNHAERVACANACFTDETYLSTIVSAMMFFIGTNDTIASDIAGATDNDIQFVVDSYYTEIAIAYQPA